MTREEQDRWKRMLQGRVIVPTEYVIKLERKLKQYENGLKAYANTRNWSGIEGDEFREYNGWKLARETLDTEPDMSDIEALRK